MASRLVIDGRRLGPTRTGVGRYLELLLDEWAISGPPAAETVVAVQHTKGIDRSAFGSEISFVSIGENWPGAVWERWGLGRVLRPGDLLFAPTNLIPEFWRGPSVLAIFDTLLEVLPQSFSWTSRLRFRRRYRRSARRAFRIVAPSRATAENVVAHYGVPRARVRVVHPGIDPAFAAPSSPGLEREFEEILRGLGLGDSPFFLFVGKCSRRRHVEELRLAFERFRECRPDIRLAIAGPTDGRTERDRSPTIDRLGHVDERTLRALYGKALALFYPSDHEGFGFPVVEAMASGCPVVTTRAGALAESAGDAAWFLERPSVDQLYRAMKVLGENSTRRAELAELGRIQARQFCRRDFGEKIKAVLREAIASWNAAEKPAATTGDSRLGV